MTILCIDTSLETAYVGIASNGKLISSRSNTIQSDHATWVHGAIREVVTESSIQLADLDAVAVTSGPGSYTGLRVGMATAKGLCFALDKPLIAENTLKLTALAARNSLKDQQVQQPVVFRPMIDARRMEVFTALYSWDLEELEAPHPQILDESSFKEELDQYLVVFCGNGAAKWKPISSHSNAVHLVAGLELAGLAETATKKYLHGQFSDLAYLEPDYFKSFYTGN